MKSASLRAPIGIACFLAVVFVAYVAGITSVVGWMLLAAAAIALLVIVVRFSRRPEPSMSESIRDVLR